MKKILILMTMLMCAVACFPRLPEVTTLESAQFAVVGEENVVWQSSDYKGKPVLIVFMGSWCPWCKKTMPAVNALKEKYGDQVEIVSAFVDPTAEPVAQAIAANGLTAKAIYDASELAEGLGVDGFPHTILFNQKHQAVKTWEGYRDEMEKLVSAEIDKLIK